MSEPSLTVTESPAPLRWSGTVPRTCAVCGTRFYAHPSQVESGRAKYCGSECRKAGQARSRREAAWARYRTLIVIAENGCHVWTGPVDDDGYGIAGRSRIHRLVFVRDHGPMPHGTMVCHTCDTPSCCNPEHLYAGTTLENAHDAMERGRLAVGTRNKSSRLDDLAVKEIRRRSATDGIPTSTLAREYGVSKPTIRKVLARQTWRHVA